MDVGSDPVLLHSGYYLTDVSIFNGVLYWLKAGSADGIAVVTKYDSDADRTWNFTEVSIFSWPKAMQIVQIPPN